MLALVTLTNAYVNSILDTVLFCHILNPLYSKVMLTYH